MYANEYTVYANECAVYANEYTVYANECYLAHEGPLSDPVAYFGQQLARVPDNQQQINPNCIGVKYSLILWGFITVRTWALFSKSWVPPPQYY